MSQAMQLPLTLSVDASAKVQEDRDRADAYAREQHDRAEALDDECRQLRATVAGLKKGLAGKKKYIQKKREEYLQLLAVRLADEQHPLCQENVELRRTVHDLRAELRKKFDALWARPLGPARPSTADLTHLLTICHPDKWQNQPAETLAHEVTVVVNKLREGGQI